MFILRRIIDRKVRVAGAKMLAIFTEAVAVPETPTSNLNTPGIQAK